MSDPVPARHDRPEVARGSAAPSRPGKALRLVFKAPVWLYRTRLGWLLGNRFLRLSHLGRRSGKVRQTVLEVVRFDSSIPEWTVVSGYGTKSDWFRNVRATPAVGIEVGRRPAFVPEQRFLDLEERREMLREYQQAHPRTARGLGRRLLGTTFDGSPESIDQLSQALPAIAFRPRRE